MVKTKPLNSNFGICTQCIEYDSYVSPGLLGSIPVRKKSESALLVFMLLGFLIKIMYTFQFLVISKVVKTKFLNSNFGICTQCIEYDSVDLLIFLLKCNGAGRGNQNFEASFKSRHTYCEMRIEGRVRTGRNEIAFHPW